MDTNEFGRRYVENEERIAKVLRGLRIYDEDLLHDTYIALYEHSPQPREDEFVKTFVEFYKNLHKRQKLYNDHFEVCDDATMIEKYDRIDEDDWRRRERLEQCIDDIIEKYLTNPLPNERNHERGLKILQLYREGLTFREIAAQLGIKCSTAHEYFSRAVRRMKANKI